MWFLLVKKHIFKYKHICRFPVLWESKYINRYFSIIFSVLKVEYFKTKFTIRRHIFMIIKFILVPYMLVLRKSLCYNQIWRKTVVAEKSVSPDIWKSMSSKRKIWMQAPGSIQGWSIWSCEKEKEQSVCGTHAHAKAQRRCAQWSSSGCESPWHRKTISGKEEGRWQRESGQAKILRLNNLNIFS